MLLPLSLSIIVVIISIWQDILLEPKREQCREAIRMWEEENCSTRYLPKNKIEKVNKKYRIKNLSPSYKLNSCPKFPR